ncbi:hypothetical protein HDU85_007065 [Gaertneriomyces sp. JEL0708]|nr:hypothetical protein HDU85_007065 [Gaertneriomyces sp. JEL0708]
MGGDDRGDFSLGKRKANDEPPEQHKKRPRGEYKVRFEESVSSSTSHIPERPYAKHETGQRSFSGNAQLKGKPRPHLERSDSMERFSPSGSFAGQLESSSSSRKPVAAFSGSFDERVPRKFSGEDPRSRSLSSSELRNNRERRDDALSRQSSSRSIKGQDSRRLKNRSNWSEPRSRQESREKEYQGDRRRVHRSSSTEGVSSISSHVPDTVEPLRLFKGNGIYLGQVKLTPPKSTSETLTRREIWGQLLHVPELHVRYMLDLEHAKRAYASWDSAQDFLVTPIEPEDFQDQARLSSLAKYLKEKDKVGLINHGSLLAIVAPSENSHEMFQQDINQVAYLQLSVLKASCALKAFGFTQFSLPEPTSPHEHHPLLIYHRALYEKVHGVTPKEVGSGRSLQADNITQLNSNVSFDITVHIRLTTP